MLKYQCDQCSSPSLWQPVFCSLEACGLPNHEGLELKTTRSTLGLAEHRCLHNESQKNTASQGTDRNGKKWRRSKLCQKTQRRAETTPAAKSYFVYCLLWLMCTWCILHDVFQSFHCHSFRVRKEHQTDIPGMWTHADHAANTHLQHCFSE